jgi:hypothetical protein
MYCVLSLPPAKCRDLNSPIKPLVELHQGLSCIKTGGKVSSLTSLKCLQGFPLNRDKYGQDFIQKREERLRERWSFNSGVRGGGGAGV